MVKVASNHEMQEVGDVNKPSVSELVNKWFLHYSQMLQCFAVSLSFIHSVLCSQISCYSNGNVLSIV